MMTRDQIYERSPDIVFRRLADASLLVPIRQHAADLNALYDLNDVSAFIWELLDGKNTLGVILAEVTAAYDVDEATACQDLFSLIVSLTQEKAVRLVTKA